MPQLDPNLSSKRRVPPACTPNRGIAPAEGADARRSSLAAFRSILNSSCLLRGWAFACFVRAGRECVRLSRTLEILRTARHRGSSSHGFRPEYRGWSQNPPGDCQGCAYRPQAERLPARGQKHDRTIGVAAAAQVKKSPQPRKIARQFSKETVAAAARKKTAATHRGAAAAKEGTTPEWAATAGVECPAGVVLPLPG